jgi:hypothetical protein
MALVTPSRLTLKQRAKTAFGRQLNSILDRIIKLHSILISGTAKMTAAVAAPPKQQHPSSAAAGSENGTSQTQLVTFPHLASPNNYEPCTFNYYTNASKDSANPVGLAEWIEVFRKSIPTFAAHAAADTSLQESHRVVSCLHQRQSHAVQLCWWWQLERAQGGVMMLHTTKPMPAVMTLARRQHCRRRGRHALQKRLLLCWTRCLQILLPRSLGFPSASRSAA